MKRRLYPQKKKPASKSRWNRTAKAASSTLSAPEKSSTPLSGVEDHLYRRGDRRRRRRDQIPERAKSDSRCKGRRWLLAMHERLAGPSSTALSRGFARALWCGVGQSRHSTSTTSETPTSC